MNKFATFLGTVCLLASIHSSAEEEEANATGQEPTTETSTDNNTAIRPLLPHLASGDDELIEETVKKLAKTGDLRLARFFELYRQGSVYNWPDEDGNVRIVVNEETEEDEE